ncbi:hypothetical protein BKA61DRAFT_591533 [Leptodontidium sp. MPI-SDFR-AT-0119]|nr:hypothetical protein BKA61DRAFT_591533 [Leptodontidium sp. MPI-SDFR-AT-0119]
MNERRVLRSHTKKAIHQAIIDSPRRPKGQRLGCSTTLAEPLKPPLLSLPPEIRSKIFKAVVTSDLILIFDKSWHRKARCRPPPTITTWPECFYSVSISPTHYNEECTSQYQHELKRNKAPGALSWLRTNKQIHTEAQSIVYQNLNIHIADRFVLAALLYPPDRQTFKFSNIRSLSLCLTMRITTDHHDGFYFDERSRFSGLWAAFHSVGCSCSECAIFENGDSTGSFVSLRELDVQVSFTCLEGNSRPVIGYFANSRPRYGKLHRPKQLKPLVYTGHPTSIEFFVTNFCLQMPVRCLKGRYGKEIALNVEFLTGRIEHDPKNICEHPGDRGCWCFGRSIDEEDFRNTGLLDRIKARLINEPMEMATSGIDVGT